MRAACLLPLFVLLGACGAEIDPVASAGPGGPNAGAPSSATGTTDATNTGAGGSSQCSFVAGPSSTCAPARHVASASDLVAEIGKLPWQGVSISKTGALSISDDLVADADLAIDASSIPGPAASTTTSTHAPLFREYAFPQWAGPGLVEGVACAEVGDHPARKGETCAKLTIAKGTTFRIRAVVEDMHPSAPTYWPFVEIERACTTACGDGEVRCASSLTCFAKGFAACAYCEGAAQEVCACREDTCSEKADGAQCFVDTSPDVEETGACRRGSCTY